MVFRFYANSSIYSEYSAAASLLFNFLNISIRSSSSKNSLILRVNSKPLQADVLKRISAFMQLSIILELCS